METASQPKIQPLPDGRHWKILEDFRVSLPPPGETFTVPAGFVTDGASAPRFAWIAVPPVGRYFPAAVVHDWLYHRHRDLGDTSKTREQADAIFYLLMEVYAVDQALRDIMLDAVRAGAGPAWEGKTNDQVPAPDPPGTGGDR